MDESNYISVREKNARYDDFVRFMNATTDELKSAATSGRTNYAEHQGEKLEWVVLEQMKTLASAFNFNADNIVHTEKQHFPDIISENYFGVEVKATKENTWMSVGSSITESLREDCVKKVFLLFGKLSVPDVDFRCKPYAECLYDISVTHNPRYLIDMDLQDGEKTVFQKIGVDYDHFRQDGNKIDLIRQYYRKKYRDNGKEMPWWIGEEPEGARMKASTGIRLYTTLAKTEKEYLKVCGFILFPEVMKSQYGKLAMWLCSRHAIVNPSIRDMYTAGGQMDVFVDDKCIKRNVSKSFCNFLMSIDSIREVFHRKCDVYNEISYYSDYYTIGKDEYEEWVKTIDTHLKEVGLCARQVMGLTFERTEDNRNVMLKSLDENTKRTYKSLL